MSRTTPHISSQIHENSWAFHFKGDIVDALDNTFDAAFPVGGFLACLFCAPLVATLRTSVLWAIVCGLVIIWQAMTMCTSLGPQYASALMYGPVRALQWAVFYKSAADTKLYHPATTGRIIGYVCLLTGVVGDGLTPVLVAQFGWPAPRPSDATNRTNISMSQLTDVNFVDLPDNQQIPTILMVLLCIFALPVPLATWRAERRALP